MITPTQMSSPNRRRRKSAIPQKHPKINATIESGTHIKNALGSITARTPPAPRTSVALSSRLHHVVNFANREPRLRNAEICGGVPGGNVITVPPAVATVVLTAPGAVFGAVAPAC